MDLQKESIIKTHGDVDIYRKLYDGQHAHLFERAKHYIGTGEVTDTLEYGEPMAKNIRTPYVVVNISKLIVDIPTLFISRSLGKLMTNYPINEEEAEEDFHTDTEHLEVHTSESHVHEDGTVFDLQQDTLEQISDNSKLEQQHAMNIKQWQIDGGLVLVPEFKNGQIKLSFKERNIYYEMDDGKTFQLRFYKQIDKQEYVHVHEEIEEEDKLIVSHKVYHLGKADALTEVEDEDIILEVTGLEAQDRYQEYKGRKRTFIDYLPFNPTFTNIYGNSALKGQLGKQDEINWTVTRSAQTFERNGKPRISVTPSVMTEIMRLAYERTGNERLIDHRDLEITEMDEQGNSIKIHQIDIDKIGNMDYVKDIIKMMLMETQTSEKAIDFFNESQSGTQSGVAKFYDLFLSVMKSEQMRDEYVNFIQRGIESCLWLLKQDNKDIIIEKPIVQQKEMLPVTSKEVTEQNNLSYTAGTQSLEQTVRNNNPEKSEQWILNEVEEIESSNVSTDSMTFLRGNMTAENFNDNEPLGNEPQEEGERDE